MLRALDAASSTRAGVKVSLRGLRGRVELNGAEGFVLEYLGEGGRFRVALTPEGEGEEGGAGEMVAVMRANLSDPVVEELLPTLTLILALALTLAITLTLTLTLTLFLTPTPTLTLTLTRWSGMRVACCATSSAARVLRARRPPPRLLLARACIHAQVH